MSSLNDSLDPTSCLFSLRDVCYDINGKRILSNITIDIDSTGITGIIGPSGSGKTTFLCLLNKLYSPSSGTIIFDGKDVVDIPSRELRKLVGMVQQRPHLFSGTIRNNLEYGPKIWKISYTDDELVELMAKIALPADFLDREIDGLSGGEQQRVSLARSLANKPCTLLLDEPTSALDIISSEIIENTIKKLSTEGMKIIIVTHSLEQTKSLTNQLLFLKDGELIEKLPTKEFFERFDENEIRSFFKQKEEKNNGF